MEFVSPALSLVALIISLGAFWRTYRQARRDHFVGLHTALLTDEMVTARRDLAKLTSADDVDALGDPKRSGIYRLLATYDLLGLYAEEGWVERRQVLAEWSYSLRDAVDPANHFLDYRERERAGRSHWPHFQSLAMYASAHLQNAPTTPAARWTKRQARHWWKFGLDRRRV